MIAFWAAMLAVPASSHAVRKMRAANDDFEWQDWSDDDPLFDPEEFTRWCESHGETEGVTRLRLVALAAEFCVLRGGVRPPPAERLYTHVKAAGWRSYRGGYVTRNGVATRPTLYRINPYAQVRS
jgi:hypothetical protein